MPQPASSLRLVHSTPTNSQELPEKPCSTSSKSPQPQRLNSDSLTRIVGKFQVLALESPGHLLAMELLADRIISGLNTGVRGLYVLALVLAM